MKATDKLQFLLVNQSRDSKEWAEAISGAISEIYDVDVPEDYLHTCIANAMMAMHDSVLNNEVRVLQEKREKLLSLLLLTDPVVGHVVVSDTQIIQHQEFLKAFPDERELLEIKK